MLIRIERVALLVSALAFLLPLSCAQADVGDTVTTASRPVSEVIIQTGSGDSFYYARAEGGWSTPGCGAAIYAYVGREKIGADAVLSAMLTARSTGKPIKFSGICGDTNGDPNYIQIGTAHF